MAKGINGTYASNKKDGVYAEVDARPNLDVTPSPNNPRPVENDGFEVQTFPGIPGAESVAIN